MRPGALLLDLDGTIFQGQTLIPGALEALLFLQKAQIPYRFITNATRMTKKKLALMLDDMGLSVSSDDIFAAPHAAAIYCSNKGYKKILLVVPDREMEEDFSGFQLVDYNPDAIVLGDMGAGFTFNLINDLFNHILGGSELVAMHKNRFWKSADGYSLDVGAFVSALEYASGRTASVMGKPNLILFILASREWNLPADKILMVGDDIEGDIGGALNAGMKSILVKTGKFRPEALQSSDIKPSYIIDSIADLPGTIDLV
jgi:HAD superfamily hydrolase (TIGR01458 family)